MAHNRLMYIVILSPTDHLVMTGRMQRSTRYMGRYDEQGDGLTQLGIKQLRYLNNDSSRKNKGVGIGKTLIPKCTGEGLFATRKFKLNEFICFYDGVNISEEQLKKMDDNYEYLWSDKDDDGFFICINAENPDSGYGRYANDSLIPQHLQGIDNMADNAKIMYDPSLDKSKPVILRALREIEPGEEIMLAYGGDYWAVYRGLDRETAQRVMECYDLPTLPPHRPEMAMNMTMITDIEEDTTDIPQNEQITNQQPESSGITEDSDNDVNYQSDQDGMIIETNSPLEGTEVTNNFHTKQSKDLPRSRVDSSYHSIADKSIPTLEYRGICITKQHDIRIATLNVNGLNTQKLSEILWWMQMAEVDILIGIDTRATEKECKNYRHQCYQTLGATSVVRVAPIPEVEGKVKPLQNQNSRVGGQIIIVNKKWGPHVTAFWKDSTGFGVVTATTLVSKNQSIQIIGTYWPVLVVTKGQSETNPLWSKVERWMHQNREKGSPLSYIQHIISVKANKHIYNGGKSTGNIALLMGDLNSNFTINGRGGCHKGTVTWAEENGWLNRSHELANQLSPSLATHCTPRGTDT